jgi:hypothetical protein
LQNSGDGEAYEENKGGEGRGKTNQQCLVVVLLVAMVVDWCCGRWLCGGSSSKRCGDALKAAWSMFLFFFFVIFLCFLLLLFVSLFSFPFILLFSSLPFLYSPCLSSFLFLLCFSLFAIFFFFLFFLCFLSLDLPFCLFVFFISSAQKIPSLFSLVALCFFSSPSPLFYPLKNVISFILQVFFWYSSGIFKCGRRGSHLALSSHGAG